MSKALNTLLEYLRRASVGISFFRLPRFREYIYLHFLCLLLKLSISFDTMNKTKKGNSWLYMQSFIQLPPHRPYPLT